MEGQRWTVWCPDTTLNTSSTLGAYDRMAKMRRQLDEMTVLTRTPHGVNKQSSGGRAPPRDGKVEELNLLTRLSLQTQSFKPDVQKALSFTQALLRT